MKKSTVVILAIMLCGIIIVGWFLWRGIINRPEPPLSVQLTLRTTPVQSFEAINTSINYHTKTNWQGDLAISIEDRSISLQNAILNIDSNDSLLQPDSKTLGSLEPTDTLSYSWTVRAPNREGNYSISGSFQSDKVSFWFTAFLTVAE